MREINGLLPLNLPTQTMCGALCSYISDENIRDFQPMGANMGILPPLEEHVKGKQARYEALSARAIGVMHNAVER